MSGTVDAAGWYISTNRELENATLPSVISEDIHNIEHYYEAHGASAPIATILYISTTYRGKTLFVRASNMPHTESIIRKKFTAFAQKPTESMVATHGYGAVLPSMYIGGALEIQFKEGEDWKRITLDIGAQNKECAETRRLTILPSNASDLGVGVGPVLENATVWTPEILAMFKTHNICTVEIHTNPTFKGHFDARNNREFCQFLESVQFQFEEILNKRVRITGVFVDNSECDTYTLPFNFWKKLYNPLAPEWPFPYSPHSTTQLEFHRSFDVDYTDTSVHCRTLIRGEFVFFAITEKGIQQVHTIVGFTPRFRVWCGRATAQAHAYATNITGESTHPAYLPILDDFASGLVIDLNGYRMNLLPLRGEIPRSERRPYASRTRIGVDVLDQDTKRKYIDARAHKDESTLRTIHHGTFKNLLKFVATKIADIVKRCNDPADEDGNEDDRLLHAIAVAPAARKASTRRAAIEGHNFETNCAELLRNEFSEPEYRVVEGDVRIRREFLGSDNKQYTGIDLLVQVPNLMNIVIQCKRKERIQPDDYESFLRSFRYAREKYTKTPIHGLFVVDKDKVTWNNGLRELLATPGVNLVFSNIVEAVQKTIDHYADPSTE